MLRRSDATDRAAVKLRQFSLSPIFLHDSSSSLAPSMATGALSAFVFSVVDLPRFARQRPTLPTDFASVRVQSTLVVNNYRFCLLAAWLYGA